MTASRQVVVVVGCIVVIAIASMKRKSSSVGIVIIRKPVSVIFKIPSLGFLDPLSHRHRVLPGWERSR